MRALGFEAWAHQTVGNVEKAKRRVTAEEVHALAWVLETSVRSLITPGDGEEIVGLPSGAALFAPSVARSVDGVNDGAVTWDGDKPVFASLEDLLERFFEPPFDDRTRLASRPAVRSWPQPYPAQYLPGQPTGKPGEDKAGDDE